MAGVSKTYPPQKQVLKNIYLSFYYGAKIGVLGLNGSGKSSLLRIIAGEDKDYQGEIAFKGDGENIRIAAIDTKNPTADGFDIVLSATTDKNFLMVIKVENLKLLQADYTVSLSSKGLAHFKSDKVQYFIAIEKNSTFGA